MVTVKTVRDIHFAYFEVNYLGSTPNFFTTVSNSGDYLEAVFPVAPGHFMNEPAGVPYIPTSSSLLPGLGAVNDAFNLWAAGKLLTGFDAERIIGIVPERWFSYHQLNAEGVRFPMVSEVAFVLDGAPLTTAHELGHTYGFGEGYILMDDGTCCLYDGDPTSGYWVQRRQEVRGAIDYMGGLTGTVVYPDLATQQWSTAHNFADLFRQFRTQPNDPEVLLVTGTIDQSGAVTLGPMYRTSAGTVSEPPPGDAAVRVLDADGNIVGEVPFVVDFRIFARPIVGTVPPTTVDTAPFAFAVPYPENAVQVQVVRAGQSLAQVSVTTQLLHNAVATIPDVGFVKNPTQRRQALQNKIAELDVLLADGDLTGARNKLRNDIRKHLVQWLADDYPTQTPLEYTKPALLGLVDELLQRLGG